jgi:hypothetical protein
VVADGSVLMVSKQCRNQLCRTLLAMMKEDSSFFFSSYLKGFLRGSMRGILFVRDVDEGVLLQCRCIVGGSVLSDEEELKNCSRCCQE